MNQTAEILPLPRDTDYFGPASVVEPEREDGTVKVSWQQNGLKQNVLARIAAARFSPMQINDEVLLIVQSSESAYVTGILSKPQTVSNTNANSPYIKSIPATDHATSDKLEVYNTDHELIFCYDPNKQTSVVNIAKGNLELRTAEGNIQLNAAEKIQLQGQSIEVDSKKLKLNATLASFNFDRLESATNTLIENAKNVYRSVKQLTQLRSGRMRTLVDETYHFKANNAMLKTEQDYKIKAEKIHLG